MQSTKVTFTSGKIAYGYIEQVYPPKLTLEFNTDSLSKDYNRRIDGVYHDCHTFLGLPYATGGRWENPVLETDLPTERYDATTGKRIAHQTTGPSVNRTLGQRPPDLDEGSAFEWNEIAGGVVESEDCYLLDVRTPSPIEEVKLPVHVHFHDGGNTENPRNLPRYVSDRLTGFGIVGVEVETPLSTFGFFDHPELPSDFQSNLNYLAYVRSLEWVQANIHLFGGDPDCVTVSGASAGGAAASLLMPSSSGLFHRAVAHSGNGIGKRVSRTLAKARGQEFWDYLSKTKPAWLDPTRTIQEVHDQDGIVEALRIGPSPQQILSYANLRKVYTYTDTGFTGRFEVSENIWPMLDGTIVQNINSAVDISEDLWDTDIPYLATWVSNEASLIGSALDTTDATGRAYLRALGIVDPTDQDAAIAIINAGPDDKWERIAYGAVVFGYGVYRNCKDFTAKGGSAYYGYWDWDSLATGREKPPHATQEQYFLNKPEWQSVMARYTNTLRMTEGDVRLSYWSCQSYANFCKYGDPNEYYESPYLPKIYTDEELSVFDSWSKFGDYKCNIVRRGYGTYDPTMEVVDEHESDLFEYFDQFVDY